MKILLEIITSNYMVVHSKAKRLKEIYPNACFAAIVRYNPWDKSVMDYLQNQTDIKYEFLYDHNKRQNEYLEQEIDYDALKTFEERFEEKSIWRVICADRGWGNAFIHGVVTAPSYQTQNSSYKNILKMTSGAIKAYRKIFEDFKPDLVLPAMVMGSITVYIFEQLCREYNLPYIVGSPVRVMDFFAYSADTQLRFPQIDKSYQNSIREEEKLDLKQGEEIFKQLMDELENSSYFDRQLDCFKIKKNDSVLRVLKYPFLVTKSLGGAFLRWLKQRKLYKRSTQGQPYTIKTLLISWKNVLVQKYQNFKLLSPKFGDRLEENQKYIFYPLHLNPEYSSQFMGKMWMDQLYLVEQLAKSIPSDWVVYVKEHPATLQYRIRPMNFYKRLAAFPNVRIAPVEMDSHDLIIGAEMVAVITGTAGWEAIQRGKPLITFASNFWDCLELSRKYTSVENLSRDIHDEYIRIKAISDEEKKKRMVHFLAAVKNHGYKITHPNQYCYEPGTAEQYELSGLEAADALKKHLDYLETEKNSVGLTESGV